MDKLSLRWKILIGMPSVIISEATFANKITKLIVRL